MNTHRAVDRRRPGLALYAGFVAASAWGGVVGLATGVLDMGHDLNHRLPFHSPAFGACALAVIVAVPATALARQAARGDRRAGETALFAGVMLIVWIAVELAFIRQFSWLQPFYVGVGVTFVVIGRRAGAQPLCSGNFFMSRDMLRGVKRRAERSA
jgi:hypothetical protein